MSEFQENLSFPEKHGYSSFYYSSPTILYVTSPGSKGGGGDLQGCLLAYPVLWPKVQQMWQTGTEDVAALHTQTLWWHLLWPKADSQHPVTLRGIMAPFWLLFSPAACQLSRAMALLTWPIGVSVGTGSNNFYHLDLPLLPLALTVIYPWLLAAARSSQQAAIGHA